MKRIKINKKRPGLAHFFKKTSKRANVIVSKLSVNNIKKRVSTTKTYNQYYYEWQKFSDNFVRERESELENENFWEQLFVTSNVYHVICTT